MKVFIAAFALAAVVASANQDFDGHQAYPYPDVDDSKFQDTKETIAQLNAKKMSPAETMRLIYLDNGNQALFGGVNSDDFDNLNEIFSADCIMSTIKERSSICDRLEAQKDDSTIYQNLSELCSDLKEKALEYYHANGCAAREPPEAEWVFEDVN